MAAPAVPSMRNAVARKRNKTKLLTIVQTICTKRTKRWYELYGCLVRFFFDVAEQDKSCSDDKETNNSPPFWGGLEVRPYLNSLL